MELTHIHLLLDRMREEQHDQTALLHDIAERQEEHQRVLHYIARAVKQKGSTRKKSSLDSSKLIALAASLWGAGFLGWLGFLRVEHIGLLLNALLKLH